MNILRGAAIVGQSGGPTSVINASVYGVIRAALDSPHITNVYGAANGIKGVLNDELYDMGQEDASELALLLHTPSSALGSCRYKLKPSEVDDTDYRRILEIFQKYDVRYFFYNGGNDSMDTCNKISKYMQKAGYECRVIGVPKTVDNDLWGTDHCPGFSSAAKYVVTSLMELYLDARVYDTPMICVVEIMGRHAGWLTAAASVATLGDCGPDLVYLPEVAFDVERFLTDVERIYKANGKVIIAVSEGIADASGKLIAEYGADDAPVDSFGHKQLGGLAATLVNIIRNRLDSAKLRGIELSLLQRCAAHCASETDVQESFGAGKLAVESAVAGATDKMVAFARNTDENGAYVCDMILLDLAEVANTEKMVPREWINAEGNGLLPAYADYLLPLIQGEAQLARENGLPRFAKLKKIKAK